jgi:hypothetical protein
VHIAAPVQRIAFDLGFEDPAYFCRFFKRHTGQSPRAYRLQAQGLAAAEARAARPRGPTRQGAARSHWCTGSLWWRRCQTRYIGIGGVARGTGAMARPRRLWRASSEGGGQPVAAAQHRAQRRHARHAGHEAALHALASSHWSMSRLRRGSYSTVTWSAAR